MWELAKTNQKKDLGSGFSLPLFYHDGVGVGSGSWGQGLGEAPEGEVTLEMLVKVSPGQAWGEQ